MLRDQRLTLVDARQQRQLTQDEDNLVEPECGHPTLIPTAVRSHETGLSIVPASRTAPRTLRHLRVAVIVALTMLTAGGCDSHASTAHTGSDAPSATSATSSSSSPTGTPTSASPTLSSPIDTGAEPAVAAFTHYITATYNAQRAPRQVGGSYAPDADFTGYSFDPMRSQESAYISSLAANGQAFRGTPPTPRIQVIGADLQAKPYPTVVLTNCPTPAPSWIAYDTKSGKPVSYSTRKVPPPYLSTVTMIFYEGHWGVQKTGVDSGRTCTA